MRISMASARCCAYVVIACAFAVLYVPVGPVGHHALALSGIAYAGPELADPGAAEIVQRALKDEPNEPTVTWRLIQLLLSERVAVAQLAAKELSPRNLTQGDLNTLANIVHEVPFRSRGCVRVVSFPGYDVSGDMAWEVLAEHQLRGRAREQQIEWLVGELRASRPFRDSPGGRASARLVKFGEAAVPRLLRVLQRDNTDAQLWAGHALLAIGTEPARRAVATWAMAVVAQADDPLVWEAASWWLEKSGTPEAFTPLVAAMWAHLHDAQVWSVIRAVGSIGGPKAIPELRKVLGNQTPQDRSEQSIQVYIEVAAALGRLGDETGRRALRDAATSSIVELRRAVVSMLPGSLGEEEARELLTRMTSDPDNTQYVGVSDRAKSRLRDLDMTAQRRKPSEAK